MLNPSASSSSNGFLEDSENRRREHDFRLPPQYHGKRGLTAHLEPIQRLGTMGRGATSGYVKSWELVVVWQKWRSSPKKIGSCIYVSVNRLALLRSSSRCTGLKHPQTTVLGPAIIVVIEAVFVSLITVISLNLPCLF